MRNLGYNDPVKYVPSICFPDNEKPKLDLLEQLFREWHQYFANNGLALEKHTADDMVFDGFYPHYFSQKKRILFIGREPRGISGRNYLDELYPCYHDTKCVGNRPLNSHAFHRRVIRIAYGIVNGLPKWHDIPKATKIGDTFGVADGLSFAFMNISKLSNDGGWQADWPVINASHSLSREFQCKEVAILEPQVVITMKLENTIYSLGEMTPVHDSNLAKSFWLGSGGNRSLLIETSHFSARRGDNAGFYEPIRDAIRRSEMAAL
jgi:hypothetical protein